MFVKKVQAQSFDTLSWTEIKAEADSIFKDGGDTAYILNEEETITEGRTSKTNHLQTINALGTKAGTLSLGYELGVEDISINLSSNLETINQGLFGVNVTGMFQNSALPNDGSAEDQWQWLAEMAPKTIRFPSGANSEFMQLYSNCDRGYGYNIEEIVKYFDITDHKMDYPDIETIVNYSEMTDPSVFNSWCASGATGRFNELRKEYLKQIKLEEGHRYIDDFIQLIKQIETANGGYKISVLLCMNIINEKAYENLNIVNYLRNVITNSENYPVNVVGVEMGNEATSVFYSDIMQLKEFEEYWLYINGDSVPSQDLVEGEDGLNTDIFLDLADRDYIFAFKHTPGFNCKIGIPAGGTNDSTSVFFEPNDPIGFRATNWNDELYSHFSDTVLGTTKYAFDAIILHTYYTPNSTTRDWWEKPSTENLAEMYSGFAWNYASPDPILTPAFNDARDSFKLFIDQYHLKSMQLFKSKFQLNYTGAGKKEVWQTEWNVKTEGAAELTQVYVNSFLHGYLLQEWWLKNLKLNYRNNFAKNFFTYSTIQNYGSGSNINLLTIADDIELDTLGKDISPYNLEDSAAAKRNYYMKRIPYFTYHLIGEISRNNAKYMKHGAAKFATNPNVLPTVFIKPAYDTIYIYYTNIKSTPQKYILNSGTLGGLYSGIVYGVNYGVAEIHAIDAKQIYSSAGNNWVYKMNTWYNTNAHPVEIKNTYEITDTIECIELGENRCVEVPAYSNGYIKIAVSPNRTPPDTKLAQKENEIEIFPNPVQDVIYITKGYTIFYSIIDQYGRKINEGEINASQKIQVEKIEQGIYFLQLTDAEGNISVHTFIKL